MEIISIGDLVTDFYYENQKIIGLDGGMTSHNIIANLSEWNYKTKVIGVRGNDSAGILALEALENLNINTDFIEVINEPTRCFHVSFIKKDGKYSFISKKRCPICNKKKWYEESKINPNYIHKSIKKDDILVIDNLNDKNIEVIKNINNNVMLDLGQFFEFEELTNNELLDKLKNKFTIIQLNNRVSNYICKRFNVEEKKLINLINSDLIIITKGKNGSTFYYENNKVNMKPEKILKEIDPTGSGDAHFSAVIDAYIKNNFIINKKMIENSYKTINKLIPKVISSFGARGHLNKLYKIKEDNLNCSCENFKIVKPRQIKRINININSLEKRVLNSIKNNNVDKLEKKINEIKNSAIFIGSGGSYAAACFSARLINDLTGITTLTLYPRDLLFRNNSKLENLFLFSYSGTTADLIVATENIEKDKINLITKGNVQTILEKTKYEKNNIFSYDNGLCTGKERGFLSFEGALAPASMFLWLILHENTELFIKECFEYWNNYFDKYFNENKKILKEILKPNNVINIFTGDYVTSAAIDLESKIIESGVYNIITHEKKNFSHGRFINFEHQQNDCNIYFKESNTTKYEIKLLNYLNTDKLIIVESKRNGILAEYDLLVASQYLTYYISKLIDIDLSKPDYSEDSMKLYFHKGDL